MLTSTPPSTPPSAAGPASAAGPVATAASPARDFGHWAAEPTAATVPLIRSRVRTVLEGWRIAADITDVLLLAVSELAGNVVLHAAVGRMRVGISLRGGWIQLEVSDEASSPPRLPRPRGGVRPDAEDGRGLLIVQLMTAESGGEISVRADAFGKSVRVRVPAA
nr:ATP-binding protein [Streptomyces sp. NBC_00974]